MRRARCDAKKLKNGMTLRRVVVVLAQGQGLHDARIWIIGNRDERLIGRGARSVEPTDMLLKPQPLQRRVPSNAIGSVVVSTNRNESEASVFVWRMYIGAEIRPERRGRQMVLHREEQALGAGFAHWERHPETGTGICRRYVTSTYM